MGNHIILVKVNELLYQLTQACKYSQLDSNFAEALNQLSIKVEAIMPVIQKYREAGRGQSPNVCLWDDFLFRVMLFMKTLKTVNHIGGWKDYHLLEQHWSQSCMFLIGMLMEDT